MKDWQTEPDDPRSERRLRIFFAVFVTVITVSSLLDIAARIASLV